MIDEPFDEALRDLLVAVHRIRLNSWRTLCSFAIGCATAFYKEEREALLFLSFFFAKPLRLSRLIGEDYGPRPGRF